MNSTDYPTVSYTASLPISWQKLPVHDQNIQTRWQYTNLVLLRALASIEAVAPLESEHERDSYMAKTLERLESKIDIALSLLARLGTDQAQLPSAKPVTLSVQHIGWSDTEPPQQGDDVAITIYISPKLPEPLVLTANVESVTLIDGEYHCNTKLIENDDEFMEWMTRTIFRYHRRSLHARHQA